MNYEKRKKERKSNERSVELAFRWYEKPPCLKMFPFLAQNKVHQVMKTDPLLQTMYFYLL